jgi:Fe2+ transport system protein FeoA
MKGLNELRVGERGIVKEISEGTNLRRRLLSMGVVPGTEVSVEKLAPLGDPIDVKLKGFHLSLRREEARNIKVEVQ